MDLKPVILHYEEVGQGTPLVLIHGFPLDHTIWQPVVDRLKSEVRLIQVDLRGYGQSPVTDGVYSMRLLAEDIYALVESLQLPPAVIVGHSMGGYVSLAYAQAYPAAVAGLALLGSQAGADPLERRQARLNTADDVARKGSRVVADGAAPKMAADPALTEPLRQLMRKADPKAVIGSLRGMADRPDMTEWLGSFEKPVVCVHGLDDAMIPPERSRMMVQLLVRAWLVELPGVGHMPMMEAPDAVAGALRQLIQMVR